MSIDDVRLPVDVERGAKGGPGFLTTIVTLANGDEQRNQEWSIARGSWDVGYGIRSRDELTPVMDFFMARRGKARGFRFKDWSDFHAEAELVGTTGNAMTRQLQRQYADTVNSYARNIVLPIAGTITIYVNSIALDSADWTLLDQGIVQFVSNPGAAVIKATFDFDIPARFDTDSLDIALNHLLAGSIPSVPIVELRSA